MKFFKRHGRLLEIIRLTASVLGSISGPVICLILLQKHCTEYYLLRDFLLRAANGLIEKVVESPLQ